MVASFRADALHGVSKRKKRKLDLTFVKVQKYFLEIIMRVCQGENLFVCVIGNRLSCLSCIKILKECIGGILSFLSAHIYILGSNSIFQSVDEERCEMN